MKYTRQADHSVEEGFLVNTELTNVVEKDIGFAFGGGPWTRKGMVRVQDLKISLELVF